MTDLEREILVWVCFGWVRLTVSMSSVPGVSGKQNSWLLCYTVLMGNTGAYHPPITVAGQRCCRSKQEDHSLPKLDKRSLWSLCNRRHCPAAWLHAGSRLVYRRRKECH